MTFYELLENRYSVRDFSDKPIGDEQLEMILNAGRMAPTAKNAQPQRIYILRSKEALDKIREITPMTFGAPVVLLVCHDENESWKAEQFKDNFDAGVMDASIVATCMMMEATALGIGSLWVRAFNQNQIHNAFNLPENIILDSILDLGYPSEESEPSERHTQRLPLSETIYVI